MTSMTDPSFDKLALLDRFTGTLERLAPGTDVPAADVAHDLRRILGGTLGDLDAGVNFAELEVADARRAATPAPAVADRLTTIAAHLESRAGTTVIPEVGKLAIDELRQIAAELDAPTPAGMFRAKPSSVDAVQWLGDPASLDACQKFAPGKIAPVYPGGGKIGGEVGIELRSGVEGAQGWIPVPVGHWIASNPGDRSDVWPIDPDRFAAKYEAAQ